MSKKFTMDELYGVDLLTYLQRVGKTKEDLVKELTEEIRMLDESYKKLANRNTELTEKELELAVAIKALYEKKIKHRKRIKNWK